MFSGSVRDQELAMEVFVSARTYRQLRARKTEKDTTAQAASISLNKSSIALLTPHYHAVSASLNTGSAEAVSV